LGVKLDKIRAFLAAPISDEVRDYLEKIILKMKRKSIDWRWVNYENLHITLKFLGYCDNEQILDIQRTISKCIKNIQPFSYELSGLGAFSNERSARVLWAGIKDEEKYFIKIYKLLERNLSKRGFKKEGRSYTPHITIARSKKRQNISNLLLELNLEKFGNLPVQINDRIILYESVLSPQGPSYYIVKEFIFQNK